MTKEEHESREKNNKTNIIECDCNKYNVHHVHFKGKDHVPCECGHEENPYHVHTKSGILYMFDRTVILLDE